MSIELHLRRLNQEKFIAASDIIDRLEVTPRDLGLEASVAHDKALRRLFARYYGRLSAEHTRVQIQVIDTSQMLNKLIVLLSSFLPTSRKSG